MTQTLSGRAAFFLGFVKGKRTRSYMSAREAFDHHPSLLDAGNIDNFLNGVEDGAHNDRWRYDQIRKSPRRG